MLALPQSATKLGQRSDRVKAVDNLLLQSEIVACHVGLVKFVIVWKRSEAWLRKIFAFLIVLLDPTSIAYFPCFQMIPVLLSRC